MWKRSCVTLILIVTTTACKTPGSDDRGKKSGSGAPQPATSINPSNGADPGSIDVIAQQAFVQVADFKTTNLRSYSESEIDDQINAQKAFFHEPPTSTTPETNACMTALHNAVKLSATMSRAWVSQTVKIDACTATPTLAFKNVTVRMLVGAECTDQDLSPLNNQSAAALDLIQCNNGGASYENTVWSGTAIITSTTGKTTEADFKQLVLKHAEPNKPCVITKTGDDSRYGPCTKLSNFLTPSLKNSGTYSKFELAGATFAHDKDLYFSTGSITFTLNNITGTMNYAGATVAPKWEAKRSGSSKKVAGTFTPKP